MCAEKVFKELSGRKKRAGWRSGHIFEAVRQTLNLNYVGDIWIGEHKGKGVYFLIKSPISQCVCNDYSNNYSNSY